MPDNKQLGFCDGPPFWWDGLLWRPILDSDDWHCWQKEPGGIFKRVPADEVPGEIFVELMRQALL